MKTDFASMGMTESVEEWFIKIAQSANQFQKAADNRRVAIDTMKEKAMCLIERKTA